MTCISTSGSALETWTYSEGQEAVLRNLKFTAYARTATDTLEAGFLKDLKGVSVIVSLPSSFLIDGARIVTS